MAYQIVGTPRFFVNMLEWGASTGEVNLTSDIWRTLPVNPITVESSIQQTAANVTLPFLGSDNNVAGNNRDFIAILGHNLAQSVGYFALSQVAGSSFNNTLELTEIVNLGVLNSADTAFAYDVQYNGFTIASFDGSGNNGIEYMPQYALQEIGSIVVGSFYEMPHSPDLSLTLSREYGGTKTIETKGGSSLSNTTWRKPTNWGSAASWELWYGSGSPQSLSQTGRRIWDLSFSYLDDGDVWGSNQTLLKGTDSAFAYSVDVDAYDTGDLQSDGKDFSFNVLTDYSFYSQVIHKTNGGQLPFIFQPNKDDNTVFAICKLDMKSIKFDQVANSVYNCKIRIREVW